MATEASRSDMLRRRLVIGGRVQGVGFRVSCARRARALGLSGWVRNLADGRVELVLQGPRESVAEVERWCAHGPQLAEVTSIDATDEPITDGPLTGGAVTQGAVTHGAVTHGAVTQGAVTQGAVTHGGERDEPGFTIR